MITQQHLIDLCDAAAFTGINVNADELILQQWSAGLDTHVPMPLPNNTAAVYIFKWNNNYLKVGKANMNSNARYQFHHYNPGSSNSNLAKSLLSDTEFQAMLGDRVVGEWMRQHLSRYNILIPAGYGNAFLHFAEAFFILKCHPKFENSRV